MIKAIDIHCHYNNGSAYDTVEKEDYLCDIPFLRAERERMNVSLCAMSSFSSVLSDKEVVEENEKTYALVQEDKSLLQWIVVDPRNEKTFSQVDEMMKSPKSLGIKLHPYFHGYPIKEFADKIFSFANDRGLTVMMHPDNMLDTLNAINKYPDMKLIIAHLGSNDTYLKVMREAKHQNVYTDTSGGASNKNNVIELAVQTVGSEKVLFGTDTYSCAFQRGRIDYADISISDKENILYKNALRLFPQLKELY